MPDEITVVVDDSDNTGGRDNRITTNLAAIKSVFSGGFEVTGGTRLKGEIIPQGAKNEALQIISAVLLTPEKVTVTNIPDIIDVNLQIELLQDMGVKVERTLPRYLYISGDDVNVDHLGSEAFQNKERQTSRICYACRTNACPI